MGLLQRVSSFCLTTSVALLAVGLAWLFWSLFEFGPAGYHLGAIYVWAASVILLALGYSLSVPE